MTKEEVPSVNPKLDAMCEMLKTIHDLNERNKMLQAQIEKMKCGQNCKHSYLYQEDRKCKFTYCDCINCKDKWELRR